MELDSIPSIGGSDGAASGSAAAQPGFSAGATAHMPAQPSAGQRASQTGRMPAAPQPAPRSGAPAGVGAPHASQTGRIPTGAPAQVQGTGTPYSASIHHRPGQQRAYAPHAGQQHPGQQHPGQRQRANQQQRQAQHPHAGKRPAAAPHRPVAQGEPIKRYQYAYDRRRPTGTSGLGRSQTRALAVVALVVIVALVGFGVWWALFRPVSVTVNGKQVSMKIGTTAQQLLDQNDDFGVKPGRLLSVSGKVLDDKGGDRATVTVAGQKLAQDKLASTKVNEGADIKVAAGADVTEDHTEEVTAVAPGVEMGKGGAVQYVSQWGKPGKKAVWKGKKSGETVDKGITEQPKNLVIASVNLKPEDGNKYMALTFDDGPSQYSPQVLDILKQKGVHATFFNLGQQAAEFSSYTKRVIEDGHELASHTNSHQYLPKLAKDALRSEISSAFDKLKTASGGKTTQMIRSPYGAYDANSWARSADMISCNILWNIDTEDWRLPGADAIKNNVLSNAYNGAIVLMHDGGGNREQDVAALPGIIDGLQAAGYKLVTVQELMKLDGKIPKDVYEGTVKMPKDAVLPEVG